MTLKSFIFIVACSFSTLGLALTPLSWETSKHTPVLFYQTTTVPMVTIHVGFKAGSAFDGKKYGLAALTAGMLNQGNNGKTRDTIADQLADTGAVYSAQTTRDMFVTTLNTLSESKAFKQATTIFSEILTQPDFPESAFYQQQNQQLAILLNEKESPNQVANDMFFHTLYEHHPYGHSIYGTPESIKAIKPKDLQTFYKRYIVPENAVIVIVGDLSPEQAHLLSENLLKNLPHGQIADPIPTEQTQSHYLPVSVPFPTSQTAFCLGQLGIDHHSPYYFPLLVGNYTLGGGPLVSRLAIEIREKRGLTYGITSEFLPMPGPGPFLIRFATEASQAKAALNLTKQVVSHFVQTGPTANDLLKAKQYMTGSFPLALSSNSAIANTLLRIAFYHLPYNYLDTYVANINAVTLDQVKTAFKATLSPEHMLVVSVGNTP